MLESYLGTFNFPGTEPTVTIGSDKRYVFPAVFFPSVVSYATLQMRHSFDGSTWSGWTSRDIEFTNFSVHYGAVLNNCGTNLRRFESLQIDFIVYEPDTDSEKDARMTFNIGSYADCETLPLTTDMSGFCNTIPDGFGVNSGRFNVTYLPSTLMGVLFPIQSAIVGSARYYDIQGFLDTTPP